MERLLMHVPGDSGSVSILLICQTYPPVIGGSEIEAQRVCSALIRRGHRVTVVCAGGDPMPHARDWIDPQGVPVRMYAEHWNGALKNVVFALRVAGMMIWERRGYHLVYFLMQGLHLAAGLPVAWLLQKPIIMKMAGSGTAPKIYASRIGRQELRWLNRWAKKILILNEGMSQEAVDHGISPDKLAWMPNPVDTNEFSPAAPDEQCQLRSRFGIPDTAPVVMYSGRLAPEKALPTMLDAFAALLKQIPNALLVLVGDGAIRLSLVEQAHQLRLSERNIRFTGRVDPHEVCLWLKIATVFVLVSPAEGFSCALEEAMSTGLPSVVSDIPANRQLIENGVRGILVPVGDSERIAAAIAQLLQDSQLRQRMGEAARAHIMENYSTKHIVARYEDLFQEVLASRGHPEGTNL
jgi:glycosyltransferase involved in cell wall biosynthesis